MNIFGYDISVKKAQARSEKRNKLIKNFLWPWQYGKELYSDEDFYAMINDYKSWIYLCSNKNATTFASVPLRLYIAKPNRFDIKGYPTRKVEKSTERVFRENAHLYDIPAVRKAVEFEEILDHPFLDLKRNVNNFMNSFSLMETSELFLELTGNNFWYILDDKFGIPREIWVIPPQNCKIVPHETKFIAGYQYTKGNQTISLNERDIIHFKFPNPRNMYYGYSILNAIKEEWIIDRNINDYENALFRNGGTLQGVFETEEDLGEYEFERLKKEIKDSFSGVHNSGKMPLLSNGVKYKPFGLPPKEMSYVDGRGKIKEIIVNCFGQSLGMYDKDSTRANSETAWRTYLTNAINPRLKRFEEKLNEKLIPRYDGRLFVAFDNPVQETEEFLYQKHIKQALAGVISINEARKEDNRLPLDSRFDEPLVPVNLARMDSLINNETTNQTSQNIISNENKMIELLEKK